MAAPPGLVVGCLTLYVSAPYVIGGRTQMRIYARVC